MVYIDKRAIHKGKSAFSLIPYVSLNQLIQQIVDPHIHDSVHDDICYSTLEIGEIDIAVDFGTFYVYINEGVLAENAEIIAVDGTFSTAVFEVISNTCDQDIIVTILNNNVDIGNATVASEETGIITIDGDFENPLKLKIKIEIPEGTGVIEISEIITTFTTN